MDMNRKSIPLILMLLSGIVTCVITYIMNYSVIAKLTSLLVVMIVFLVLGNILKWTLDLFDRQNERKAREAAEAAENENLSETGTGQNGE